MARYWALVALSVLMLGSLRAEEDELPGLKPGTAAPALETKLWVTADGKAPDMKGKVLLIDFWFQAWPACVSAIPDVKKLAEKYAAKGLVVVGPSQDAEEQVKKFKEKHEIGYPLIARCKELADAFGVKLYPTIFIVGKDGKIVFKGDVDEPGCVKAIEKALEAK